MLGIAQFWNLLVVQIEEKKKKKKQLHYFY